jgi:polysaccharide biosynthesis transport protein
MRRDLVSVAELPVEFPGPEGFSLTTLTGALRRRKGLILSTVIVTSALAFGVIAMLPARYTATASLEIKQSDTRALVSKPVAKGLPEWLAGDNAEMLTQVDILRARALATKVAKTLKLADDPEFQSALGRLVQQASALMRNWLPASWRAALPWPASTESVAQREETAVQHLQRAMTVKQAEGSHIIQVGVTANTSGKAAGIANAAVKQYLDDQVTAKYQITNRAYQWATEQVVAQRQQLIAAEHATVDYMASHGLIASNGLPPPSETPPGRTTFGGLAGQQLFSLQDELVAARGQLAAKQARVAELDIMQAGNIGFGSLPEVLASPVIAELQKADAALSTQEVRIASTYGAASSVLKVITSERASIRQRLAAEIAGIAQNIRHEAAAASDRVVRLKEMLNRGRQDYTDAERASVELRELTRDVTARRALYDKLLVQVNEITEQLALTQPDATLISPAVPPSAPTFPSRLVLGGIGVFGSLLLGLLFAAIAEHNDKTLRTGPQAERSLGVPNLGLVPFQKRRRREPLHAVVFRQPQSVDAEAIRTILAQLLPGSGVVLVTSALPKEGKTATALGLAAAAARSGRRTVLVDADLRHPSVAREARLDVQFGLAEYMSGAVQLDDVVQADPTEARLHIVPLRGAVSGTADLLLGWDVRGLIDTLRKRYNCIFLDLPPSVAVSDIRPFTAVADATLFVAQWGSTSSSAALNGITVLSRIGLHISGIALTKVDLKRHALYGYEQFGEYHRRYLEYFYHQRSTP